MKNRGELIASLVSVALYFLALQFIASIIARYSRDLGIDIASTSIIWSSLFLVSFVLRPMVGYIADRISSYFTMCIGSVFLVGASIAYLTSNSFSELLIGRVVQGIGNAFFISPSIAAVATAAGDYAGIALGMRSTIIAISGIVAPPIAGTIVDSIGYYPVFLIAIALSASASILNGIKYRSRYVRKLDSSISLGWRDAINRVVVVSFIAALASGGVFLTISGLLQSHYRDLGYGASIYGYFYMIFGISSTVSRLLAGSLASKKNPAKIAIVGHTIVALSMAMLSKMYTIPLSYVVAIVYGIGIGLTIPTQQLLVISSVSQYVRNRAIAIYAMGFDLGGFIAPIIFGYYIAANYGYDISYGCIAILPLIAITSLIYVVKKKQYRDQSF